MKSHINSVINDAKSIIKDSTTGKKVIDLASSNLTYNTISQLEAKNPNKPEIIGM